MFQKILGFGLNSILYQRGIYPAHSFVRETKYGLPLLVTKDPKLQNFLSPLLKQIQCSLFFIIFPLLFIYYLFFYRVIYVI